METPQHCHARTASDQPCDGPTNATILRRTREPGPGDRLACPVHAAAALHDDRALRACPGPGDTGQLTVTAWNRSRGLDHAGDRW